MEPWEVAAREEIRELVAAYAHLADTGRFDQLLDLFAEDGVLHGGDAPEARGREEIRRFLTGTGADLRSVSPVALIRHHVSNLSIEVLGPDEARGIAYFFVVTDLGPDHWGRYRDQYVRETGRWRFKHRRARLDGYSPGSWSARRRTGAVPEA